MASMMVAELGKMRLDSRLERGGGTIVGADDEHGVVAGDSADNFFPLFLVERGCDRLRTAHGGEHDDEILRLADFEAEAGEGFDEQRRIVVRISSGVVGQSVAAGALEQLELADVARERGLGDMKSAAGELAAQGILTTDGTVVGDGGLDQEFANCVMALALHKRIDMRCCRVVLDFSTSKSVTPEAPRNNV